MQNIVSKSLVKIIICNNLHIFRFCNTNFMDFQDLKKNNVLRASKTGDIHFSTDIGVQCVIIALDCQPLMENESDVHYLEK